MIYKTRSNALLYGTWLLLCYQHCFLFSLLFLFVFIFSAYLLTLLFSSSAEVVVFPGGAAKKMLALSTSGLLELRVGNESSYSSQLPVGEAIVVEDDRLVVRGATLVVPKKVGEAW